VPQRSQDLHETLLELERQLASERKLDPRLREELRLAIEEIRERIDAGTAADAPLADRVSDLMLRFEAAHPALADAVGAVVRQLAGLGI
jgi:hypothetical protein